LIILTDDYEQAVKKVVGVEDNEFIDFHARRLVEMAGHIIMSYLLLLDTNREASFLKSAKNYIGFAKAQVKANAEFIRSSELSDLGMYKYEMQ
jgi:hypothetical protein